MSDKTDTATTVERAKKRPEAPEPSLPRADTGPEQPATVSADTPPEAASPNGRPEREETASAPADTRPEQSEESARRPQEHPASSPAVAVNWEGAEAKTDPDTVIEASRLSLTWIADRIPGARFVELAGDDHFPWIGDQDALLDEVQEFLTGDRASHDGSRVLATILFTDIVDSTRRAGDLGDAAWRELLDEHDRVTQESVRRWRGRLVKSTGDGALATFDGPGRAIGCAQDIVARIDRIGLDIRAGLHTGELEIRGAETSGVAVHLAARIAALANSGEVLVLRTVRDLVAGSRIHFTDCGSHELKGFPEPWPIYAVS